MRQQKDIVEHVSAATGLERGDVVKVVDATFAYLRASLMQGTDVAHPSLGRILVKTRDRDGAPKKVYRYQPELKPRPGKGAAAASDAD